MDVMNLVVSLLDRYRKTLRRCFRPAYLKKAISVMVINCFLLNTLLVSGFSRVLLDDQEQYRLRLQRDVMRSETAMSPAEMSKDKGFMRISDQNENKVYLIDKFSKEVKGFEDLNTGLTTMFEKDDKGQVTARVYDKNGAEVTLGQKESSQAAATVTSKIVSVFKSLAAKLQGKEGQEAQQNSAQGGIQNASGQQNAVARQGIQAQSPTVLGANKNDKNQKDINTAKEVGVGTNLGVQEHKEDAKLEQQRIRGKKLDESTEVTVVNMTKIQNMAVNAGVRLIAKEMDDGQLQEALQNGAVIAHFKNTANSGSDIFVTLAKDGTMLFADGDGNVVVTTLEQFKAKYGNEYEWSGKVMQPGEAGETETISATIKENTKGVFFKEFLQGIGSADDMVQVQGIQVQTGGGIKNFVVGIGEWIGKGLEKFAEKVLEAFKAEEVSGAPEGWDKMTSGQRAQWLASEIASKDETRIKNAKAVFGTLNSADQAAVMKSLLPSEDVNVNSSEFKAMNDLYKGLSQEKRVALLGELKKDSAYLAAVVEVTSLYENVLGRAPEQAGLDGWVDAYRNGLTFSDMVKGFFQSAEFKSRPPEQQIAALYKVALGREADAEGLKNYTEQFVNGDKSFQEIANELMSSQEYTSRAAEFRDYVGAMKLDRSLGNIYPNQSMANVRLPEGWDKMDAGKRSEWLRNEMQSGNNKRIVNALAAFRNLEDKDKASVLSSLAGTNINESSNSYKAMQQLFNGLTSDKKMALLHELSKDKANPTVAMHLFKGMEAGAYRNQMFAEFAKGDNKAAARIIAIWPDGTKGDSAVYGMIEATHDRDKNAAKAIVDYLKGDLNRKDIGEVLGKHLDDYENYSEIVAKYTKDGMIDYAGLLSYLKGIGDKQQRANDTIGILKALVGRTYGLGVKKLINKIDDAQLLSDLKAEVAKGDFAYKVTISSALDKRAQEVSQTDAQKTVSQIESWLNEYVNADPAKKAQMAATLGLSVDQLANLSADTAKKIIDYLKSQGDNIINCGVEAFANLAKLFGGAVDGIVNKNDFAFKALLVDILTGTINEETIKSDAQVQLSMFSIKIVAEKSYGLKLNASQGVSVGDLTNYFANGGEPIIANVGGNHYVVITGIKDGKVTYTDADGQEKTMSEAEFKDWFEAKGGYTLSTGSVGGQSMTDAQAMTVRGAEDPGAAGDAAWNEAKQNGASDAEALAAAQNAYNDAASGGGGGGQQSAGAAGDAAWNAAKLAGASDDEARWAAEHAYNDAAANGAFVPWAKDSSGNLVNLDSIGDSINQSALAEGLSDIDGYKVTDYSRSVVNSLYNASEAGYAPSVDILKEIETYALTPAEIGMKVFNDRNYIDYVSDNLSKNFSFDPAAITMTHWGNLAGGIELDVTKDYKFRNGITFLADTHLVTDGYGGFGEGSYGQVKIDHGAKVFDGFKTNVLNDKSEVIDFKDSFSDEVLFSDRLAQQVTAKDASLMGLSFGGVGTIVQFNDEGAAGQVNVLKQTGNIYVADGARLSNGLEAMVSDKKKTALIDVGSDKVIDIYNDVWAHNGIDWSTGSGTVNIFAAEIGPNTVLHFNKGEEPSARLVKLGDSIKVTDDGLMEAYKIEGNSPSFADGTHTTDIVSTFSAGDILDAKSVFSHTLAQTGGLLYNTNEMKEVAENMFAAADSRMKIDGKGDSSIVYWADGSYASAGATFGNLVLENNTYLTSDGNLGDGGILRVFKDGLWTGEDDKIYLAVGSTLSTGKASSILRYAEGSFAAAGARYGDFVLENKTFLNGDGSLRSGGVLRVNTVGTYLDKEKNTYLTYGSKVTTGAGGSIIFAASGSYQIDGNMRTDYNNWTPIIDGNGKVIGEKGSRTVTALASFSETSKDGNTRTDYVNGWTAAFRDGELINETGVRAITALKPYSETSKDGNTRTDYVDGWSVVFRDGEMVNETGVRAITALKPYSETSKDGNTRTDYVDGWSVVFRDGEMVNETGVRAITALKPYSETSKDGNTRTDYAEGWSVVFRDGEAVRETGVRTITAINTYSETSKDGNTRTDYASGWSVMFRDGELTRESGERTVIALQTYSETSKDGNQKTEYSHGWSATFRDGELAKESGRRTIAAVRTYSETSEDGQTKTQYSEDWSATFYDGKLIKETGKREVLSLKETPVPAQRTPEEVEQRIQSSLSGYKDALRSDDKGNIVRRDKDGNLYVETKNGDRVIFDEYGNVKSIKKQSTNFWDGARALPTALWDAVTGKRDFGSSFEDNSHETDELEIVLNSTYDSRMKFVKPKESGSSDESGIAEMYSRLDLKQAGQAYSGINHDPQTYLYETNANARIAILEGLKEKENALRAAGMIEEAEEINKVREAALAWNLQKDYSNLYNLDGTKKTWFERLADDVSNPIKGLNDVIKSFWQRDNGDWEEYLDENAARRPKSDGISMNTINAIFKFGSTFISPGMGIATNMMTDAVSYNTMVKTNEVLISQAEKSGDSAKVKDLKMQNLVLEASMHGADAGDNVLNTVFRAPFAIKGKLGGYNDDFSKLVSNLQTNPEAIKLDIKGFNPVIVPGKEQYALSDLIFDVVSVASVALDVVTLGGATEITLAIGGARAASIAAKVMSTTSKLGKVANLTTKVADVSVAIGTKLAPAVKFGSKALDISKNVGLKIAEIPGVKQVGNISMKSLDLAGKVVGEVPGLGSKISALPGIKQAGGIINTSRNAVGKIVTGTPGLKQINQAWSKIPTHTRHMMTGAGVYLAADEMSSLVVNNRLLTFEEAVRSMKTGASWGGGTSVAARGLGLGIKAVQSSRAASLGETSGLAASAQSAGKLKSYFNKVTGQLKLFGENPEAIPISFGNVARFTAVGPFFTAFNMAYGFVTTGQLKYTGQEEGLSFFQGFVKETAEFAKMGVYLPTLMGVFQASHTLYGGGTRTTALASEHSVSNWAKVIRNWRNKEGLEKIITENIEKTKAMGASGNTLFTAKGLAHTLDSTAFTGLVLSGSRDIAYSALKFAGLSDKDAAEWAQQLSFYSLFLVPTAAFRPAGFKLSESVSGKETVDILKISGSEKNTLLANMEGVNSRNLPIDIRYMKVGEAQSLLKGEFGLTGSTRFDFVSARIRATTDRQGKPIRVLEGTVKLAEGDAFLDVPVSVDGKTQRLKLQVSGEHESDAVSARLTFNKQEGGYRFRLTEGRATNAETIRVNVDGKTVEIGKGQAEFYVTGDRENGEKLVLKMASGRVVEADVRVDGVIKETKYGEDVLFDNITFASRNSGEKWDTRISIPKDEVTFNTSVKTIIDDIKQEIVVFDTAYDAAERIEALRAVEGERLNEFAEYLMKKYDLTRETAEHFTREGIKEYMKDVVKQAKEVGEAVDAVSLGVRDTITGEQGKVKDIIGEVARKLGIEIGTKEHALLEGIVADTIADKVVAELKGLDPSSPEFVKEFSRVLGIREEIASRTSKLDDNVTFADIFKSLLAEYSAMGKKGIGFRAGQLDTIRIFLNSIVEGIDGRIFISNPTAAGKTLANVTIAKLMAAMGYKTDLFLPNDPLVRQTLTGDFIEGVTYADVFGRAITVTGKDGAKVKLGKLEVREGERQSSVVKFDEVIDRYNKGEITKERLVDILENSPVLVYTEKALFLRQQAAQRKGHYEVIDALNKRMKETHLLIDEAHLYMKNVVDLIIAGESKEMSAKDKGLFKTTFEQLVQEGLVKNGKIDVNALKKVSAESAGSEDAHIVFTKEYREALKTQGINVAVAESIVSGMMAKKSGKVYVDASKGVKPISDLTGQVEYSREFQDIFYILGAGREGGITAETALFDAARKSQTTSTEGLFTILNRYNKVLAVSGTPPNDPILKLWGFEAKKIGVKGGVDIQFAFAKDVDASLVDLAIERFQRFGDKKDVQVVIQTDRVDAIVAQLKARGIEVKKASETEIEILGKGGFKGKIVVTNRIAGLGVDYNVNLILIAEGKYADSIIRQAKGRPSRHGEYGEFIVVGDKNWADSEFGKIRDLMKGKESLLPEQKFAEIKVLEERLTAFEGRELSPGEMEAKASLEKQLNQLKLETIQKYMDTKAEGQVYVQTVGQYMRDFVIQRVVEQNGAEFRNKFMEVFFAKEREVKAESAYEKKQAGEKGFDGRDQLRTELETTRESLLRTLQQLGLKDKTIIKELRELDITGKQSTPKESLKDVEKLQDIVDVGYKYADEIVPVEMMFRRSTPAQQFVAQRGTESTPRRLQELPKDLRDAIPAEYVTGDPESPVLTPEGQLFAYIYQKSSQLLGLFSDDNNNALRLSAYDVPRIKDIVARGGEGWQAEILKMVIFDVLRYGSDQQRQNPSLKNLQNALDALQAAQNIQEDMQGTVRHDPSLLDKITTGVTRGYLGLAFAWQERKLRNSMNSLFQAAAIEENFPDLADALWSIWSGRPQGSQTQDTLLSEKDLEQMENLVRNLPVLFQDRNGESIAPNWSRVPLQQLGSLFQESDAVGLADRLSRRSPGFLERLALPFASAGIMAPLYLVSKFVAVTDNSIINEIARALEDAAGESREVDGLRMSDVKKAVASMNPADAKEESFLTQKALLIAGLVLTDVSAQEAVDKYEAIKAEYGDEAFADNLTVAELADKDFGLATNDLLAQRREQYVREQAVTVYLNLAGAIKNDIDNGTPIIPEYVRSKAAETGVPVGDVWALVALNTAQFEEKTKQNILLGLALNDPKVRELLAGMQLDLEGFTAFESVATPVVDAASTAYDHNVMLFEEAVKTLVGEGGLSDFIGSGYTVSRFQPGLPGTAGQTAAVKTPDGESAKFLFNERFVVVIKGDVTSIYAIGSKQLLSEVQGSFTGVSFVSDANKNEETVLLYGSRSDRAQSAVTVRLGEGGAIASISRDTAIDDVASAVLEKVSQNGGSVITRATIRGWVREVQAGAPSLEARLQDAGKVESMIYQVLGIPDDTEAIAPLVNELVQANLVPALAASRLVSYLGDNLSVDVLTDRDLLRAILSNDNVRAPLVSSVNNGSRMVNAINAINQRASELGNAGMLDLVSRGQFTLVPETEEGARQPVISSPQDRVARAQKPVAAMTQEEINRTFIDILERSGITQNEFGSLLEQLSQGPEPASGQKIAVGDKEFTLEQIGTRGEHTMAFILNVNGAPVQGVVVKKIDTTAALETIDEADQMLAATGAKGQIAPYALVDKDGNLITNAEQAARAQEGRGVYVQIAGRTVSTVLDELLRNEDTGKAVKQARTVIQQAVNHVMALRDSGVGYSESGNILDNMGIISETRAKNRVVAFDFANLSQNASPRDTLVMMLGAINDLAIEPRQKERLSAPVLKALKEVVQAEQIAPEGTLFDEYASADTRGRGELSRLVNPALREVIPGVTLRQGVNNRSAALAVAVATNVLGESTEQGFEDGSASWSINKRLQLENVYGIMRGADLQLGLLAVLGTFSTTGDLFREIGLDAATASRLETSKGSVSEGERSAVMAAFRERSQEVTRLLKEGVFSRDEAEVETVLLRTIRGLLLTPGALGLFNEVRQLDRSTPEFGMKLAELNEMLMKQDENQVKDYISYALSRTAPQEVEHIELTAADLQNLKKAIETRHESNLFSRFWQAARVQMGYERTLEDKMKDVLGFDFNVDMGLIRNENRRILSPLGALAVAQAA